MPLFASLPRPLSILTTIFAALVIASPAPSNIGAWLHDAFLPQAGSTLSDEIKCYNLPYGGIGFVSHILTYYTVGMLIAGLTPLFPRPREKIRFGWTENVLSILALCGTIPITIMTMYACRRRWQFVLIAIWKMLLSLTLSFITIHVGQKAGKSGHDWRKLGLWTILYGVGTFLGMIGLISIVKEIWDESHPARIVTYVLGTLGGFPFALWAVIVFVSWLPWAARYTPSDRRLMEWSTMRKYSYWTLALLGLWCAFYCDWILATIDGNYSGEPSSDIAVLYWIYFAAKRLPMLSI
ncbi:hypothetical protein NA57DRAFT_72726 [Rhizodiscina lignyota]|uniref:Uncharacterized protein n=1 Tax=Rhizodiscina lignyota TaxID=1504668 RepID=A0A9P4IKY4_9PEZI|nr:hypothetical protein NA57DRAFT_72726 [Rhizodiscina lignyota]